MNYIIDIKGYKSHPILNSHSEYELVTDNKFSFCQKIKTKS